VRELEYFFAALRFFTRLPVPAWVGHSPEQLNGAARYFPLVGVLVGFIGAAMTLAASLALPISLAVVLGMAATILATGAFHEDGFSDVCDGFGGGWDKAQVLAIMKDSRVGSYGAIGVALLLLAKWNALMEMDETYLLSALVAGHAVSRFASTALIYALDYVRDDDSSKSKPLAVRMGPGALAIAAVFGLAPAAVLLPLPELGYALAAVAVTTLLAARYFVRRIGGYTGDCLGATQQATELAFYLGLLCDFTS
jgi:adenosylcobinamide-GDP ribazoletransferase